jgi:hypothetical protein
MACVYFWMLESAQGPQKAQLNQQFQQAAAAVLAATAAL